MKKRNRNSKYTMFYALLQQRGIQISKLVSPIVQRFLHAESALVPSESNLKALILEDRQRKKAIFKKHFVESLFINEFQNEFVEYPEIETIAEVESLFNLCKYAQRVLIDHPEEDAVVSDSKANKILAKIKKFGLSGFKLSKSTKGFGFLESEYLCFQDVLSCDLPLSKTISENEIGIHLIKLFGNDLQKTEYLLKLASSEIMTCIAHLESDSVLLKATASFSSDDENYVISGKKKLVYNASHADIIIASATVDGGENQKPTFFLIDKNTKGVHIDKPFQFGGLKDLDICEVTFDEVKVPLKNVLGTVHGGDKITKQILINQKLSNGIHCTGCMRKLIDAAIKHCIHNKFFKKNKYERNLYEIKIGELVSQLYAAESMVYLVGGRLDGFDNADVFLESLIVKIFTSESLQNVLQQTILILGTKYFENNEELSKLISDCQYLAVGEESSDYLKVVLSTAGCKYVLDHNKEASIIQKFKSIVNFQNLRHVLHNDPVIMNRKNTLNGYLHLLFKFESDMVEDCVYYLKNTTNHLIKKYGDDILNKEDILKMLADMVICIYVMAATLARSSRAFCLSVKRHNVDDYLGKALVLSKFCKFRYIQDTLNKSDDLELFKKVDLEALQSKGYSMMYPPSFLVKR